MIVIVLMLVTVRSLHLARVATSEFLYMAQELVCVQMVFTADARRAGDDCPDAARRPPKAWCRSHRDDAAPRRRARMRQLR